MGMQYTVVGGTLRIHSGPQYNFQLRGISLQGMQMNALA